MTFTRRGFVATAGATVAGLASRLAAALPMTTRSIPRPSDSLISFRFPSTNAAQAVAAYHPTRVEWHYAGKPAFVQALKAQYGIPFVGGTINASPDLPDPSGYAQALDGQPLVAPWMRGTKFRRATTANPATRAYLLAWADRTLDAGCDGIQVDDGAFQWIGEEWGGDFSPTSLAGFGPWLAANVAPAALSRLGLRGGAGFDYKAWLASNAGVRDASGYAARRGALGATSLWRAYQGASVLGFYGQLRQHLDQRSPAIPLSMNFGQLEPNEYLSAIAPRLDYTVTEVQANDPPWRFALAGATAEAAGLPFAGCFSGTAGRPQLRQAIAACSASGIVPVAPWDGFVAGNGGTFAQRFTPPPGDYIDLFEFARRNAAWLEGWQGGATVGVVVAVDRYKDGQTNAIVQRLVAANVPFRVLMAGGTVAPRALTRAGLAGLSGLVLAQPATQLDSVSRALVERSGLPIVDAAGAEGYTIGQVGMRGDWRIAVRQRPGSPTKTVLHVVPSTVTAQPLTGGALRLAAGTPFGFERAPARVLLRPGLAPVPVEPAAGGGSALVYTLPFIETWGILAAG